MIDRNDQPILSLRDFRVSFPTINGTVQAVRGIDLDIHRGEMVGVVGESGSGKSVTFLGLMGLLPRTAVIEGSAKIDGEELVGRTSKQMRSVRGKRIAMIFQDPLSALNPVHRIGKQITEMLNAHQSLSKVAARERAIELLDMVGIPQPDQRAQQYPHEFSGGMRQRVMIAMAIANDPDVLIADEPTTALDVTVQAQILDVMQRIQRELNTAIVLITHDLGVVARVVDRVQVMYAGRAVERASVENLFRHASHPYTRGLMASLPSLDAHRLVPIPGAPPNMLEPPPGCAFAPRCSHRRDECVVELPSLRPFGAGETSCVRAEELVEVLQ
ncbi:MAG TPA: ABC transporter ATP-binding protein [Ilumatobacter sp.]|nr:ABC transporter ATP-binding protein [Ilumatobacter sp.]